MTGRILQNGNIIEVKQGDSFTIVMKITKNNSKINLSGARVDMQVRNNEDTIMFNLSSTPIDAENGRFVLSISPAHTNIPIGSYRTDIKLITPDGGVNTIFPADVNKIGIFRVTETITR
jgi:hypothetical protein